MVDEKADSDIEALLANDETTSVVDTLLAMPHALSADDESWEKIMHARLQERLARKMREMLEGEQRDEDSRSVA